MEKNQIYSKGRGYGGCLDNDIKTKEQALARLSTLTLDEKIHEAREVVKRTTLLARIALGYEIHNEEQFEMMVKHRSEEELNCELEHMYERNQLALELMQNSLAASSYLDILVEEITAGKRKPRSK